MSKKELKQVSRVKDYKICFGTAAGQRVLRDLMQTHFMLGSSFNEKSRDLIVFNEGERNVVLRILTLLKVDPIKLQELIVKNQEENEYE